MGGYSSGSSRRYSGKGSSSSSSSTRSGSSKFTELVDLLKTIEEQEEICKEAEDEYIAEKAKLTSLTTKLQKLTKELDPKTKEMLRMLVNSNNEREY